MEWHSDLRGEIATQIGMRGQWHGYRGAFDVSARAKTIDTLREAMSYRLLLEGQRESRAPTSPRWAAALWRASSAPIRAPSPTKA
ncbi:hypothetical protein [Segniliparus rugosus]|uniref:Uncharacterized protein n=1 Tax=Segniliparus rugosus (strain ATCC BAA-974 / DSM 45345 / CCUG 50838 / CIP 108380 / JCM 13579 / CDC 945) TaxID=679197 RepID=E5XSD8_SEGRC|nr:hypothetical protein [Segniliparus rugosus]EFV12719.1 hypothetical protein HMPREF9336_02410 [Segniliparus rugosus ATCC BAA-974]